MKPPSPPKRTAGQAIRDWRTKRHLSLNDLAYTVRDILPDGYTITPEGIRQYEVGLVSERGINPVVIIAIAKALDCRVSDLSPLLGKNIADLKELFASSRCTADSRHLPVSA